MNGPITVLEADLRERVWGIALSPTGFCSLSRQYVGEDMKVMKENLIAVSVG